MSLKIEPVYDGLGKTSAVETYKVVGHRREEVMRGTMEMCDTFKELHETIQENTVYSDPFEYDVRFVLKNRDWRVVLTGMKWQSTGDHIDMYSIQYRPRFFGFLFKWKNVRCKSHYAKTGWTDLWFNTRQGAEDLLKDRLLDECGCRESTN